MSYTVVVTDCNLGDLDQEMTIFGRSGARVVDGRGLSARALSDVGRDADALLVQWMPLSADVLDRFPRCRAISRYGIGVDMIDLAAATSRGIHVFNVSDYCIDEVATHTMLLLLALNRHLPALTRIVERGAWTMDNLPPIRRVSEQVLGVVGFGRIGKRVVAKARGLGLNVLVCDPLVPPAVVEQHGVQASGLEQLLARSDYVTLHCPLTSATRHLISAAELALMQPSAFLINVSRGPLVDEQALHAALSSDALAGAALDVLESEPPRAGHPLLGLSNVIVTPHVAYHSLEALAELRQTAAHNIVRLFAQQELRNLVNPDVQQVGSQHT